jgi:hypothetical protein
MIVVVVAYSIDNSAYTALATIPGTNISIHLCVSLDLCYGGRHVGTARYFVGGGGHSF